ncbi:MAG: rod-binding protein [Candidatus Eisenbacteria bacterium]
MKGPESFAARAAMSAPSTPWAPVSRVAGQSDHDRLRSLARELEGVFLNQLFQAMRSSASATTDQTTSTADEMFHSLFDQAMASAAAQRLQGGVAEVLYRQMAARLQGGGNEESR